MKEKTLPINWGQIAIGAGFLFAIGAGFLYTILLVGDAINRTSEYYVFILLRITLFTCFYYTAKIKLTPLYFKGERKRFLFLLSLHFCCFWV